MYHKLFRDDMCSTKGFEFEFMTGNLEQHVTCRG